MTQEQIDNDQAGLVGDIFSLHLGIHGGKVDENCEFCQHFIISRRNEPPITYKFVIIDLSPKGGYEIKD